MYRRSSPTTSTGDWFSLNGDLQTSEVHSFAFDPVSSLVFGGLQDNGANRQTAANSTTFLKPCCKATFVEPSGEVFELTDSERLPNLSSARQFRSVDGRHLLVSKPMADPLNASIFCVYGVLLLLYNNALHPITILMAVPLSAGGAFGALLATNNTLSLPALIGLLMLIGIATKNSILLVDYAEMAEHEQGMSRFDAVIDACKKRVQPVLMTTIAMIAGMMPIALGLGADASFRAPMAVAVIGGLITSTLLSLVVIPAAYTVIDDVSRRFKGRNVVAHKV